MKVKGAILELEERIAGIPCIISVYGYEPYVPAKVYGPPEHCYPAEGGCSELEVLDRNGYAAPWLKEKMTDDDVLRIDRRIMELMEDLKAPSEDDEYEQY